MMPTLHCKHYYSTCRECYTAYSGLF